MLQRIMSPKAYTQAMAWERYAISREDRLEAYLLQLTQELVRFRAGFTEETFDPEQYDLTPYFDPDVVVDGLMTDDEMLNAAMRWAGVG